MAKKKKKPQTIDLDETSIILKIPKDAVALDITASIILDGALKKVEKSLTVSDIHTARQDFLDNVVLGDNYDAEFAITDKGMEYLNSLKEGGTLT